jgi:Ni,Fe-hydrogenase I cytochrome b subunit
VGIFCIIGYFLIKYRSKKIAPIKDTYSIHLVEINDTQYIQKTIQEIRKYITIKKEPKHSWAHLPLEISRYFPSNNLIRILAKLETTKYSGKDLSTEEIITIQSDLIKETKL